MLKQLYKTDSLLVVSRGIVTVCYNSNVKFFYTILYHSSCKKLPLASLTSCQHNNTPTATSKSHSFVTKCSKMEMFQINFILCCGRTMEEWIEQSLSLREINFLVAFGLFWSQ